jgi:putative transposase
MTAILYVLRTGIQWKALPLSLGASSTIHDLFQRVGPGGGVHADLAAESVESGGDVEAGFGVAGSRRLDGQSVAGREKKGKYPTDRGKLDWKRSLITEAHGIPIGFKINGANRHDKTLLAATLHSVPWELIPQAGVIANRCLDAGCRNEDIPPLLDRLGYILHTRKGCGEEKAIRNKQYPGYKPRCWVIERFNSWINRFSRLLIRWKKKASNYLAFLHLAFALICLCFSGLFGSDSFEAFGVARHLVIAGVVGQGREQVTMVLTDQPVPY